MTQRGDEQDGLKRLLEVMECDDLDEAIAQAEFDVKESLAAARFIKKACNLPENEWPSAHDRRLYLALESHLIAKLASAPVVSATTRLPAELIDGHVVAQHMEGDDRWSHGYNAGVAKMAFLRKRDAAAHSQAEQPGAREDAARLDWLENNHTLHKSVEIVYVVDGYQVCLLHEDGVTELSPKFEGHDLRSAIDEAMRVADSEKAR
jgi:hypothetical protein